MIHHSDIFSFFFLSMFFSKKRSFAGLVTKPRYVRSFKALILVKMAKALHNSIRLKVLITLWHILRATRFQSFNNFYVLSSWNFITDSFGVQQRGPYFESNQNSNITVLENESVMLKCIVKNKGNKTVSTTSFLKNFIRKFSKLKVT